MWRWGRERSSARVDDLEVVAEAERLLTGRMLDLESRKHERSWTLIGSLAHSDWEQMQILACDAGRTHCDPGGWRAALAFLADVLLSTARTQQMLLQVQRQVLIPLELRLLGGETLPLRAPADFVALVTSALGGHLSEDGR